MITVLKNGKVTLLTQKTWDEMSEDRKRQERWSEIETTSTPDEAVTLIKKQTRVVSTETKEEVATRQLTQKEEMQKMKAQLKEWGIPFRANLCYKSTCQLFNKEVKKH
jgi:hypothetical protein